MADRQVIDRHVHTFRDAARIRRLPITEKEKRLILSENAQREYGIQF